MKSEELSACGQNGPTYMQRQLQQRQFLQKSVLQSGVPEFSALPAVKLSAVKMSQLSFDIDAVVGGRAHRSEVQRGKRGGEEAQKFHDNGVIPPPFFFSFR